MAEAKREPVKWGTMEDTMKIVATHGAWEFIRIIYTKPGALEWMEDATKMKQFNEFLRRLPP